MELKKALDVVYGDKAVKFAYAELFADDRDLSQNEFAEEFRGQALKDRRHRTNPPPIVCSLPPCSDFHTRKRKQAVILKSDACQEACVCWDG